MDKKENGLAMTNIHIFSLYPLQTSELVITKKTKDKRYNRSYNINTRKKQILFVILLFIFSNVNRFKTIPFTANLFKKKLIKNLTTEFWKNTSGYVL